MCGIAGILNFDRKPVLEEEVRAMCDAMVHRGPDDAGYYLSGRLGIGMRRLSIIDIDGGHQPVHNEDRTVWVVFNGEIYNYHELRQELETAGHRFYTSSDTETIVHAYEQWGESAFSRLRGMFGIALWDRTTRTLLLARDRAGIKPLHFVEHGSRIYFGSEIKSLIAAGVVEPEIDLEALDHYLSYLYAPRDRSFFRSVRKLPPGHFLRWRDGNTAVVKYWEIGASEAFRGTSEEAAAALRAVLSDAVRSHLVSDVPLGAFLSGGVDSSIVVGLMAEASSRPLKTFSIGFDEPQFDELEHARRVAQHFATDHHEFVVRPDGLAILDRLIEHFDEPFADSSAIPTWYVSEIARRHVTVVLSGDGGDELFGGYDRYLPHPRVAQFDRLAVPGARAAAGAVWPLLPHGARGKNFLRHVSRSDDGRYLDSVAFFQQDEKAALYSPDVRRRLNGWNAERAFATRFSRFSSLPQHSRMMRLDFETYLPEDVLTKVDRMSMANSLEARVPLLDHPLVEFACSLPPDLRIRGGTTKYLLKRVLEGRVPAEVLTRAKQGFAVPLESWFSGSIPGFFRDELADTSHLAGAGISRPEIGRLFDRFETTRRRDYCDRLWALVVLNRAVRRLLGPRV